jgi:hypothetical protein
VNDPSAVPPPVAEAGPDETELDQPVPHPNHAKAKLLALFWCAHHEMVHAGQVPLLCSHLGYSPTW